MPEPVERSETRHWRDLAEERDATLHRLTRRPLVRLAVGIHRRVSPAERWFRDWWERLHKAGALGRVALAALPGRPSWRGRQAAMAEQVKRLGAAPHGLEVSVLTCPGWGNPGWRDATGALVEVVVVGAGEAAPDGLGADVQVNGEGLRAGGALALAADAASRDLLCFVPSGVEAPAPGWLARLAEAVEGDTVATTPTLVHPNRGGWQATEHDLLVRSEGFELGFDGAGAPVVEARGAGDPVDAQRPPAEVDAAPLTCLVVDRAAYVAAGGLAAIDDLDAAAVDLCTRLREQGGKIVHVPAALVFDARPVPRRAALHQPIDPHGPGWRWYVERNGSVAARTARHGAADQPARWVITTSVPSARIAHLWGDWHLAQGLASALRRLDVDVLVQTHDQMDSLVARSRDVHLAVHGLTPVRRTAGQRHLVWVVSHPETFDVDECDAADLVLVASVRFAEHLRARSATPVEVLLQATDAERFTPQTPDPAHQHAVTVVAKTRNVLRPIVADALEAGLRPAIYGSGWEELVEPTLVVSDYVDNAQLPVVYSSAGVVLNDHWDTMRAWGFVSNRIFDVLACGAPVISDEVREIHDLFAEAVPTYRTSAELGTLVRETIDDPVAAHARAAVGRSLVLAHHTFDHRARELLDLMERHGLCEQAGMMPA